MRVIETKNRPIKIWASIIDPQTEQQLFNMAKMPFIHSHVAVMPDAHLGKGSTVGTVIATDGAIIPAAVGVDIGCLRSDTKIPLVDGTMATLLQLHARHGDNTFYVYSLDEEHEVVPGLARCVKTRTNAELCEVEITGGEVITCTPDHEFLLRDGSYREARLLTPHTSLMPLYRSYQKRDGYESLYNPGEHKKSLTHKQFYSQSYGAVNEGDVIHHQNHDHHDNRPANFLTMSSGAHSAHHRQSSSIFGSEGFQSKKMKTIRERGYFFGPKHEEARKETAIRNITAYMSGSPEHFKQSVADNGKRGYQYLAAYYQSEEGKEKTKERNSKIYVCDICEKEVRSPQGVSNHMRAMHNNHKVRAVRMTAQREDVYCLQVEKHHNFALAAGVFVHNCGMAALKLPFKLDHIADKLGEIRHDIERSVPTGRHGNKAACKRFKDFFDANGYPYGVQASKLDRAGEQLGSLGGGNHFIEICGDENDGLWIVLHSGSRNIGKCLAEHHIYKAKGLMKQYFISTPDPDLAYLTQGTAEFADYLKDLMWAQKYAAENRAEMLERVLKCIRYALKKDNILAELAINCHHNYTSLENHFGKNIYVTRKGAVSAQQDQWGIIPGSMGTKSYIVQGKGNPQSFCSCSHGAGRIMSRTKAKEQFTVDDLIAQTAGVNCRKDSGVIDEIPGAYKPIDVVMEDQKDLVDIRYTLKQVICVKG